MVSGILSQWSLARTPESLSRDPESPPRSPEAGTPVIRSPDSICVDDNHVLHPFFRNRFDAGPVCLASIVNAFNYRVEVLQDGAAPALWIGRSRREECRVLDNLDISWDQQVAIMLQIVSALVLDVPEASTCLDQLRGVPPNVLLSSEPWGHIDHNGSWCMCLWSDRTGAYIHGLSVTLPPRDMLLPSPDRPLGDDCVDTHKLLRDLSDLVSIHTCSERPGSVPYVFFQTGVYGQLLLATYEGRQTGTLPACEWLTPVTRGAWRLAPPADAGGGGGG